MNNILYWDENFKYLRAIGAFTVYAIQMLKVRTEK